MVGIVPMSAEIVGNIGPNNEQNLSDLKSGFDELPDNVLVNILSRLSLKESARTSVLALRWRYLWTLVKILRFDHRDTSTGKVIKRKKKVMKREKFKSWVNTVVELYQARSIEGIVISFETQQDQLYTPLDRYRLNKQKDQDQYRINPTTYDSWVDFAMQKEVTRFELNLSSDNGYVFPSVERLKSHYHGVMSSPFYPLRALRLVHVSIRDEVVHYFLESCPNLEELCIRSSKATLNLRVKDPPRLRVLEISSCCFIQSVEISAVNLVSLTYEGRKNLVLKEIPNLSELAISGNICESFFKEPKQHWSYSNQLEKLVLDSRFLSSYREFVASGDLPQLCSLKRLEMQVFTLSGRSLLFFTSLLNACPQLCEFRIELNHLGKPANFLEDDIKVANSVKFVHTKLKVVEIAGYKGCSSEEHLLLALFEICPSIESVAIDTDAHPQLENHFSFLRMVARARRWRDKHSNLRNHAGYRAKHSPSTDRIPPKHRALEARIRPRSEDQGAPCANTRHEARKHARRLLSQFSQRIKSTIR